MSTFIGLRKMCNLPVESMSTGGALWFKDLTITDPYFILPLISTATLFYILEVGSSLKKNIYLLLSREFKHLKTYFAHQKGLDTGTSAATMTHTMKWIMRAILLPTGFFFTYQSSVIRLILTNISYKINKKSYLFLGCHVLYCLQQFFFFGIFNRTQYTRCQALLEDSSGW